jgi:hypothetical protein
MVWIILYLIGCIASWYLSKEDYKKVYEWYEKGAWILIIITSWIGVLLILSINEDDDW